MVIRDKSPSWSLQTATFIFNRLRKMAQKDLLEDIQKRLQEEQDKSRQLEELLRRQRTLINLISQAKREWESAVDALPELIALVDAEHRVIRCNRAMIQAMGVPFEEAIGQPCYKYIHQTEAPPSFCPHVATIRDGRSHKVEIYDEKKERFFEISTVPYRDPDGTVIGSVHIVSDITFRKRAEKERDEMQAKLMHAQKLEAVGELAAGIAHEINTPIQYVRSNLDFLKEGFDDIIQLLTGYNRLLEANRKGQDVKKLVKEIEEMADEVDLGYLKKEVPLAISQSLEGVDRVSHIIRAMKEFSHPVSRAKEHNDLNRIIENTVTISKNEWKYVADLEMDLDPNLPMVPCLADEIGQVVLNMIVNAVHALQEKIGNKMGEEKGRITIKTRQNNGFALIKISDTGTGIPDGIINRIFDPFFTTKEVGKGSGQGLAISRSVIVEKHGGDIEVETRSGKGTTFTIKLPLKAA